MCNVCEQFENLFIGNIHNRKNMKKLYTYLMYILYNTYDTNKTWNSNFISINKMLS